MHLSNLKKCIAVKNLTKNKLTLQHRNPSTLNHSVTRTSNENVARNNEFINESITSYYVTQHDQIAAGCIL